MIHSLYRLTSPSGKQYVGVTGYTVGKRLAEHPHFSTAVGRALNKYGKTAFYVEILAKGSEEYIYDLEKKAIGIFGTMAPLGYNLREGGAGGRHTADSRRKISVANKGKKVSEVSRKRIGAASRGRVHDAESRKKMSRFLSE